MSTTKADLAAADRILRRAVRKASVLIRAGEEPRPTLEAALVSANVLLEDDALVAELAAAAKKPARKKKAVTR